MDFHRSNALSSNSSIAIFAAGAARWVGVAKQLAYAMCCRLAVAAAAAVLLAAGCQVDVLCC
jgi:hypothetical protein